MNGRITTDLLAQFSDFITARTALSFPRARWSDLERRAVSAAGEFGFADPALFIRWLISSAVSQTQIEMLASYLTNSETYFWREPKTFAALTERILPQLVRLREDAGKLIRIWSAGCSTGEEPYSIAIALRQVLPFPQQWNIAILATDINPRILQKAKAGVYSKWSFRNAPDWLKDQYFLPCGEDKLEIRPEIKKMVTFFYLNLAEDIYPSALNNTSGMDIIFCRNVLMYFAPLHARRVIQGLFRSLRDGGFLIVSASELSSHLFAEFDACHFSGAMVYRKASEARSAQDLSPPAGIAFSGILQQWPEAMAGDAQPFAMSLADLQDAEAFPDAAKTVDEYPAAYPSEEKPPPDGTDTSNRHPAPPIADAIRSYADNGKLSEALALCDQALAGDKLDPGLHYLRAVILQEQDQQGEAVLALKRTLYLDPNHALAHFTLGNLMLRRGDAAVARKCFANVLELIGDYRQDDILPESEGLTAGRFREIIQATIQMGAPS